MINRTIVLGDIHGHFDQLQDVMDQLHKHHNLDLSTDVLVTLGDLVDGGKDVKSVLDWAMNLKKLYPDNFIPLIGNHETLLLDAFNPKHPVYGDFYLWKKQGGKQTLDSFIPKDQEFSDYDIAIMQPEDLITKPYLDFIKSMKPYYETEEHLMVHAGVLPDMTLEETKRVVDKIAPEDMEDQDMLYQMVWIRDQFIDSDYDWGKKIIFGHTAQPSGHTLEMDNKICIDTIAMVSRDPAEFAGSLTAIILPEEIIVQSKRMED